jgi:hypothetical protein
MKLDYAERARALVGTRFRPQGRGPDGLDCVGVLVATFELDERTVARNYRQRGPALDTIHAELMREFWRVPLTQLKCGDVMFMSIDERQAHLGVRTDAGFVHAHAGLRRVVETPGMPEWPVLAVYRRRVRRRTN